MATTPELQSGVREVRHHGVSIVYSGMEVGNVDRRFGDMDTVLANRAKLIGTLNPTKYIIQMPQLSSEFVDLSNIPVEELEDEYPTDGLFIDKSGIALGLNPADCIAMALYDKGDSSKLAIIHAGRQGVDGGIHQAAVEHMADAHGVEKQDMRAFFSPLIGPESYYYPEISAEQLADPKWRKFIDRRDGNYHVDLAARVIKDLAEFGLEPKNVQMGGVDVGAEGSGYFSHTRAKRLGEPAGRNGFAAMLRAD